MTHIRKSVLITSPTFMKETCDPDLIKFIAHCYPLLYNTDLLYITTTFVTGLENIEIKLGLEYEVGLRKLYVVQVT